MSAAPGAARFLALMSFNQNPKSLFDETTFYVE